MKKKRLFLLGILLFLFIFCACRRIGYQPVFRTSYEGTGLGLSIVKKLVDCMGGDIILESQEGKGTRVTLHLAVKIDRNYYEKEAKGDQQVVSIKGVNVLLVEDNELNMEIAEYMLKEQGAVVDRAENGKEAVEAFEAFAASEEGHYGYYDAGNERTGGSQKDPDHGSKRCGDSSHFCHVGQCF